MGTSSMTSSCLPQRPSSSSSLKTPNSPLSCLPSRLLALLTSSLPTQRLCSPQPTTPSPTFLPGTSLNSLAMPQDSRKHWSTTWSPTPCLLTVCTTGNSSSLLTATRTGLEFELEAAE